MDKCSKLNNFCYVCGRFTIMPSRRKISSEIHKLYEEYFSQSVHSGVLWAPSIVCTSCVIHLNKWKSSGAAMPFGVPMIWIDPEVHDSAKCYACVNHVVGMNRLKSGSFSYIGTTYSQLPLPHSAEIPVPEKPIPTEEHESSIFESVDTNLLSVYQPSNATVPCNHIEITQNRLDIMVRRLKLSQRQSILLTKDLKKSNILACSDQSSASVYEFFQID